jgi:hypothetical protein
VRRRAAKHQIDRQVDQLRADRALNERHRPRHRLWLCRRRGRGRPAAGRRAPSRGPALDRGPALGRRAGTNHLGRGRGRADWRPGRLAGVSRNALARSCKNSIHSCGSRLQRSTRSQPYNGRR